MKVGLSLKTEFALQKIRIFLLVFVLHFFILQPLLNAIYPEMAQRALFMQNAEENEEEDEVSINRILEEEIIHHKNTFYCFTQWDSPKIQKTSPHFYHFDIYSCALAEVNTPPPELFT